MSNLDIKEYDIIVVGGGHAGLEACAISAQFGLKVGLMTLADVPIASAPCNPCIGGVGKGQVVRELDALGGVMGMIADQAGIQYRTLNESKGYAVHSTRVQIDKNRYPEIAADYLKSQEGVDVILEKVNDIKGLDGSYTINRSYRTKKIIMTVGTFLGGKLHTGSKHRSGGRMDAESSASMMDIFKNIKLLSTRFKTGTPARIYTSSIDFSVTEEQPSDDDTPNFHWRHFDENRFLEQVSCYLTRTNQNTIDTIAANKEKSPMYNGQIQAVGARYCPSIEDKVHRYPEKNSHHVFLEPEGLDSKTVYPSGVSSSLPEDVQDEFIRTIAGLEKSEFKSYGYAVEYDVVDTTELTYGLEHKNTPGLYFAGQVNGTSGYEEAAGQGFIAGINASYKILGRSEIFKLDRYDSYIGVMIEDLITVQRDEPYRLFTARSENRLYIREDNVYKRMKPYRDNLGLKSELDMFHVEHEKSRELLLNFFNTYRITRDDEIFTNPNSLYTEYKGFTNKITLAELIKWPKVNIIDAMAQICMNLSMDFDTYTQKAVAVSIKYDGYIKRSEQEQKKVKKLEHLKIDWRKLCQSENISFECKQRIEKIQPTTFGQLKQMDGIRQATLAAVVGNYF